MPEQHAHSHNHHIHPTPKAGPAFATGLLMNLGYLVFEAGMGFYYNSLSLLSDAGHNLSDVASLLLSFIAIRVAAIRPSAAYSYGFGKGTILASLMNSLLLLGTVVFIGFEAVERFMHPAPVPGGIIAWVAGLGILVNAGSAWLFHGHSELNARGAYLHLMSDAAVSAIVVAGGIAINMTGLSIIDPLLSVLVMGILLKSAWGLLKESLAMSLDAVPATIALDLPRETIRNTFGVISVHHLHVWPVSTTETALTAHIVVSAGITDNNLQKLKAEIRHNLQHIGISHATLETEAEGLECADENENCI
ncbi:MAG: cation diffusion facilitator family transporter [Bacteroidota bacterium]